MRAICTAVVLLSMGVIAAGAQGNAATEGSTLVLDSPMSGAPIPIEEFSSTGPYLPVEPGEPGGRTGRVWFRTAYGRLFIAGTVDGPPPDFARSREEIRRKDHVEIWLSAVQKLDLPVIGWGNQFDDEALPNGAACATTSLKNKRRDRTSRE